MGKWVHLSNILSKYPYLLYLNEIPSTRELGEWWLGGGLIFIKNVVLKEVAIESEQIVEENNESGQKGEDTEDAVTEKETRKRTKFLLLFQGNLDKHAHSILTFPLVLHA